ncbi:MAG: hypothetical protein RIM23_21025 [Coleofasciculus sp. G3-WIS-01]
MARLYIALGVMKIPTSAKVFDYIWTNYDFCSRQFSIAATPSTDPV